MNDAFRQAMTPHAPTRAADLAHLATTVVLLAFAHGALTWAARKLREARREREAAERAEELIARACDRARAAALERSL